MSNPFNTDSMASGYATARPPVHPRVIERIHAHLQLSAKLPRALDVGCGAGLSTGPLHLLARQTIGLEPASSMLQWTAITAPHAQFVVAAAEVLPFPARSMDLITAAGSLNYVDLDRFFPEAARVLAPHGALVVYDFSPGRGFADSPSLDGWFEEFMRRYPAPHREARPLDPGILAELHPRFRLTAHEYFAIPILLNSGFYLNYMMTETNVAAALREGVLYEDIRAWCAERLELVFHGDSRDVLFRGYIAYLAPRS
jgi:SAM-dependent methyltransferase